MSCNRFKKCFFLNRLTSDVLQSSSFIYVTTYTPDLIAIIDGGTARSVTLGKSFSLDGSTFSYDPVDPTGTLNYKWSCK